MYIASTVITIGLNIFGRRTETRIDERNLPPAALHDGNHKTNRHHSPNHYRTHIWNSYCIPFSSCVPSGTSNPTHSLNSACVAFRHDDDPSSAAIFWKSGMYTSHSSKDGERMRVRRTRSTKDGEEGGRSNVSLYRDAPPITNARLIGLSLLWGSVSTFRADFKSVRSCTGAALSPRDLHRTHPQ